MTKNANKDILAFAKTVATELSNDELSAVSGGWDFCDFGIPCDDGWCDLFLKECVHP